MDLNTLLLVIGGLIGAFFYQRSKRRSAEALNENVETKEKLLNLDKEKNTNDANLLLENERRNDLRKQLEEDINDKEDSINDIADDLRK